MLDLHELEQLEAFARLGTLSAVAERFHVSTPSVTRSMRHLEDEFGVPLFHRERNRISLNETGRKAVEHASLLLSAHMTALHEVRDFDRNLHAIRVVSCGPAPLWTAIPRLTAEYPGRMVESRIDAADAVLKALQENLCDLAFLPFPVAGAVPYCTEHLHVSVVRSHELASRKSVSFSDIDGYSFLLRSGIGFWDELCRGKMPSSRFFIQADNQAFDEIAVNSSLPCFATDLGVRHGFALPGRVSIPVSDPEAGVTFFLKNNSTFEI